MTNEEIKRGYLICNDPYLSCKDCPYNDNYVKCSETLRADARELIVEQEQKIERLKDENTRLTEKLKQVLLAVDTVKEMIAMCNIDEQRKRAVQDFAEKVKGKSEMFLVAKGDGVYGEKLYVSIEEIDELLKEYEE